MENYRNNNDEEKNSDKKTIVLVIIIVILLSLITSCSCTSKFFGKIGRQFENEKEYDIDDDNNEKETIKNQDLKFDANSLEMALSDTKAKLGFNYKNINPTVFTCSTSDAEVATCYVNDDYVVINPKKAGNIVVTLQTEVNGKIYQATAKVKISDIKTKYIDIEANDGVINLAINDTKKVHYTLVGLTGDVKAIPSDKSIVSVEAKDGILKIKALKEGTAEIKLSVISDGVEYSTIYNINVIKNTANSKNNGGSGNNSGNKGNSNSNGNNTGNSSNNGGSTNNGSSNNNGGSNGNSNNENTNPTPQNNTYLKNLEVLNSKYKLNKAFTKDNKSYEMTVAYNEKNLSFKATKDAQSSKLSYKLNGLNIKDLNNLPLKDGDNTLEIIVTSKSGKQSTYTVKIHKPIRTVSLEHSTYNIILEESPYKIKYFVYEDSKQLSETDYDKNDIKASLSNYQTDCNIEVTAKEIILTPNDNIVDKTDNLTVTYNDKSATSKVNFTKYKLTTDKNYDLSLLDVGGSKTIILNTNLFTNRDTNIKLSDDKKTLEICSKDDNYCAKVEVLDDTTGLKLEYTGELNSPSSLPIKLTASNSGISKIKITGTANGKQIADINVEINVVDTYILTLKAMEGVFNASEKEYQIRVSSNSSVNLTKIGEPYYIDSDCKYHKFKGYSKEENGTIVYNLTDKNIVENIEGSMTLYANYEEDASDELPPDDGRIVIRNIPLFHNEEYYQKYKKDKVIYPGAKGEYTIYLNNKSKNKINITGITLEEDTICIENKGCLNMGYDIEYSKSGVNTWENLFGNASNQYWILNKNSDIIGVDDYYKASALLNNKIELKPNDPNDVLTINVKWKWVDDDSIDKLIGNKSAAYDDSINNMYTLSLAVNYEIVNDSCENN